MTEQELVDFAIEQINSHDEWAIEGNGRTLMGPPVNACGGFGRHLRVGQGLGTPIRPVVGDIIIVDEDAGVMLMDAVVTRARQLQSLHFTKPVAPPEPVVPAESPVDARMRGRWFFPLTWVASRGDKR